LEATPFGGKGRGIETSLASQLGSRKRIDGSQCESEKFCNKYLGARASLSL